MIALSPAHPYPGLRPFDLGDQDYFFGRDAQVRGLREKLRMNRLVAVVGRSGCGKSSLVRAGLIPRLHEESQADATTWRIATFRPQGRPIAGLAAELLRLKPEPSGGSASDTPEAAAMRRDRVEAMLRFSSLGLVEAAAELGLPPNGRLLIVVDQFEEIFRFEPTEGKEADEPTAFVRLLLSAAQAATPQIDILLTMRLDFLGDCTRFQGLPEAISDGQFLVSNLNRAERREAIEKPALRCGRAVSPALTQRLLNDVGDDPDLLPVLQHVLMRTWTEAAGASVLELSHYTATGGMREALSRHADVVLGGLSASDQRTVERVFKALSDLDRRGRAIRRPQRLGDLAAVAATDVATVTRIVETFRAPENCFLMPPVPDPISADTAIDISHESLLRRWDKIIGQPPQREGWLVEEDRDGKIYRSLVDASEPFVDDPRSVLPPALARQRQAWWTKTRPNAEWAKRYGNAFDLVQRFLAASATREQRQRTIVRGLVGTAVAMLVIGVITGAMWLGERRKAAEALEAKMTVETERNTLEAEKIANNRQLLALAATASQATAQAAARQQEIAALQRETARLQAELARAGRSTPQEVGRDDEAKQVATPTAAAPVTASVVNQEGIIWIGSVQKSNLQTLDGTPISPADVQVKQRYRVAGNTYLRQGMPDTNYVQQPSLGVLVRDAIVLALEKPIPYTRPTGEQYWMAVYALPPASLPTVYFHFATAPRAQAEQVSQKLQELGYKLPGAERTEAAQGKREVRYFYDQDAAAARKLAEDTARALQAAGFPAAPPVAVQKLTNIAEKNVPGVVELWLDLTGRSAAAK